MKILRDLLGSPKYSQPNHHLNWKTHQLRSGINIIKNPAVFHRTLHSTRPQGFGNGGQGDHTLASALGEDVTLHLLPAGFCHVGTVVHYKHRLMGD